MTGLIRLTVLAFSALPVLLATAATAQDTTPTPVVSPPPEGVPHIAATDTTLEDWQCIKRPVVVFADSPNDPRFLQQMELLDARQEALNLRDVVVILDTDPSARSSVRRELRARGFMLVVLAKDGSVVIRKPSPWDVREISRSIDKLPLRQQEIREAND